MNALERLTLEHAFSNPPYPFCSLARLMSISPPCLCSCGRAHPQTLSPRKERTDGYLSSQAVRGSYAMPPALTHNDGESAAAGSYCTYSPNGDWIATAGGCMLHLWHASTGRRLGTFPLRAPPTSLAVGAGGRVVAVGDTAGRVYVVQVLVETPSPAHASL